jgi:hypothetical protein
VVQAKLDAERVSEVKTLIDGEASGRRAALGKVTTVKETVMATATNDHKGELYADNSR